MPDLWLDFFWDIAVSVGAILIAVSLLGWVVALILDRDKNEAIIKGLKETADFLVKQNDELAAKNKNQAEYIRQLAAPITTGAVTAKSTAKNTVGSIAGSTTVV